jgi:hypothetical protein
MGGANLLTLEDYIPEQLHEIVSIEGSPCLEYCKSKEKGAPPFAIVNGVIIDSATVGLVLDEIKKQAHID